MNKHASELGKLGRGKKKTLSTAERKRRAKQMLEIRKKRWQ